MGDSGTFSIAILISLIIVDTYNQESISFFNVSLKVEQIF